MQCDQFRAQIDAYTRDELGGAERRQWREHLGACADCRRHALTVDPSLVFVAAPAGEQGCQPADADVERCVASVSAMIRQERISARLRGVRRRQRSPWWVAAAALVICAFAAILWQLGGPHGGGAPLAEHEAVAEAPAVHASEAPPTVEVEMEDVRVYQFSQAEDEVVEVLIVNPALEL